MKPLAVLVLLATLIGTAVMALWPRTGRLGVQPPATASAPSAPAVYRTDTGLEPDTCVSAWLLTRRVSPGAAVVVGPAAPEAISFDVPGVPLSRRPGQCVSRVICEHFGLRDDFAVHLAGVAQELELTPWSLNPDPFFEQVRAGLGEAVNASVSEQDCMDRALSFLDEVERHYRASRPGLYSASTAPAGPDNQPRNASRPATSTAPSELRNLVSFGGEIISGSAPECPAAFDALQAMGIKTIICVDGAAPEAESAAVRGMRYVHLPILYSGISQEQGLKLTRAFRDLPRPIYVHCHKGIHRGPAAAGFAMVCLGETDPDTAVALMRKAGASEHYQGLYAAVAAARPLAQERIDAVAADFPAKAPLVGFTSGMAEMGRIWERLEELHAARWSPPSLHPDLDPVNEARLLSQLFTAFEAEPVLEGRPPALRAHMHDEAREARGLLSELERSRVAGADQHFQRLAAGCRACHHRFRDAP